MNSGEISVGQFVTFLLISTRMTMPLWILGMLLNQLQKGEAASRRVFAVIDLEPSIFDREGSNPSAGTNQQRLISRCLVCIPLLEFKCSQRN